MRRVHLTDLAIRQLPASQNYVIYTDTVMLPMGISFGIRVGKHSRTFVIMRGAD
jgi:hypothetical protein